MLVFLMPAEVSRSFMMIGVRLVYVRIGTLLESLR